MDNFVAQHQDKSRNALSKAVEASFLAWLEELRADEAQFSAEKIMMLGVIYWRFFLMLLRHLGYLSSKQIHIILQPVSNGFSCYHLSVSSISYHKVMNKLYQMIIL